MSKKIVRRKNRLLGKYLHGNLHPVEGLGGAAPASREGVRLLVVPGDRHGNVLWPDHFIVGGVESAPTRPGDVNLRPRVRGPVLTFPDQDIAGDKTGT